MMEDLNRHTEETLLQQADLYFRLCLLEPLGYIPPAEAEANYYKQLSSHVISA